MAASHHFRRYGTTRETLGWVALNQRANAAFNPNAIYRDPLSMDDYLSARLISTPFGLYDCDVPCDGAVAIVVSAREASLDRRRPACFHIQPRQTLRGGRAIHDHQRSDAPRLIWRVVRVTSGVQRVETNVVKICLANFLKRGIL